MAIGKPTKQSEESEPIQAAPQTIKRIENNTSCYITLPPVDEFINGIRLMPGLNTVPIKYLEALEEFELPAREFEKNGKKVMSKPEFPGRKALEQLQLNVRIVRAQGEHFGPQITIHEDPMADREDGPPPPPSLPQNKDAAMALIRATTNRAALKRWSEQGTGEVPQAAAAKLNGIVFSPSASHGQ